MGRQFQTLLIVCTISAEFGQIEPSAKAWPNPFSSIRTARAHSKHDHHLRWYITASRKADGI
jgi:hypothetical protein